MGNLLLIVGVALWSVPHLFRRLAPERHAAMGSAGRGLVAVAVLAGLMAMVQGYRMADTLWLWSAPRSLVHVNNLLVLVAFYLFAVSALQTNLARRIRHPQLSGMKAWAVAHLLVVGSVQGVILFGGLLAWAVASVILANRANRTWTPPAPAPMWKEGAAIAAAVVMVGLVGWIHALLGPWPFG